MQYVWPHASSASLRCKRIAELGIGNQQHVTRYTGSSTTTTLSVSFTHTPFGVGRNTLVGAYTQDWDMAVDKRVKVSERINLRYRLTMLDVFNHRNWGVPPARVDLASFADPHQNDVGPLTLPIPGARSIRMGFVGGVLSSL